MSQYGINNKRFGDPRLNADSAGLWLPEDQFEDWEREARTAANLAWLLVDTDAYCMSFLHTLVALTLGPSGLKFRSKYQADELTATTESERTKQREIKRWIQRCSNGFNLDASNQISRTALEKVLCISAHVTGDGFGVRVFNPKRPNAITSSAWRHIGSERVVNPTAIENWSFPEFKKPNGETIRGGKGNVIWEGLELDSEHIPQALWVRSVRKGIDSVDDWERIPYRTENGIENVIHRFTPLRGSLRGFSTFAPVYITAKQLKGINEAHFVGKRALACMPLAVSSSDEKIAAKFATANATFGPHTKVKPGTILFLGDEGSLQSPNWSYQGNDFKSFTETAVRSISATKGIPWVMVLRHIEGVSMASGRIALDMAREAAEALQDDHIEQVTKIIDRQILREGIARRKIAVRSLERACMGKYLRPRAPSTDKNRESDAALKHILLGRPPDEVHAEFFGEDYEENVLATAQCMSFAEMHGVPQPGVGHAWPETPPDSNELPDRDDGDEKGTAA